MLSALERIVVGNRSETPRLPPPHLDATFTNLRSIPKRLTNMHASKASGLIKSRSKGRKLRGKILEKSRAKVASANSFEHYSGASTTKSHYISAAARFRQGYSMANTRLELLVAYFLAKSNA